MIVPTYQFESQKRSVAFLRWTANKSRARVWSMVSWSQSSASTTSATFSLIKCFHSPDLWSGQFIFSFSEEDTENSPRSLLPMDTLHQIAFWEKTEMEFWSDSPDAEEHVFLELWGRMDGLISIRLSKSHLPFLLPDSKGRCDHSWLFDFWGSRDMEWCHFAITYSSPSLNNNKNWGENSQFPIQVLFQKNKIWVKHS